MTYRVLMRTGAVLMVEVEADDPEQAKERATIDAQSRIEAGVVPWHEIEWEHDNWEAVDVEESE